MMTHPLSIASKLPYRTYMYVARQLPTIEPRPTICMYMYIVLFYLHVVSIHIMHQTQHQYVADCHCIPEKWSSYQSEIL